MIRWLDVHVLFATTCSLPGRTSSLKKDNVLESAESALYVVYGYLLQFVVIRGILEGFFSEDGECKDC